MNATISLVIAICAFIVSVIEPMFEYLWNKKMNKTNLEAQYFMNIYGKYLMEDLPKAREYIHFNNCCMDGTNELINVIRNIRRSSLFFKGNNKNFYQSLCKELEELEDCLLTSVGEMTNDQFCDFMNKCNLHIDNIYITVNKALLGNDIKKY